MNVPSKIEPARAGVLVRVLKLLENGLFGHRCAVLGGLVLFTLVMAWFAPSSGWTQVLKSNFR